MDKHSGGQEIPLSSAAILTEQREPAKLMRIDGRPAALVNAHADLAATTPVQARRRIAEEMLPGLLAKYPDLVISHDAGARDEREMLRTLAVIVPIVLLAIYALIASFLRSYWKPFVIVIGIPIAAAGAVFGHWVLGWHLTAVSIFGIIGASGVIVNDGLVLLHRYSTLRRENEMLPGIAAISGAARDRFRAVFLTSLTTVLGLSPLLYERSDELLFIVPFAVSMLGALVASTAFTLFVLPAVFMLVEGWREAPTSCLSHGRGSMPLGLDKLDVQHLSESFGMLPSEQLRESCPMVGCVHELSTSWSGWVPSQVPPVVVRTSRKATTERVRFVVGGQPVTRRVQRWTHDAASGQYPSRTEW